MVRQEPFAIPKGLPAGSGPKGRRYRIVELLPSSKTAAPAPSDGRSSASWSRCTLICHAAMLLTNVALLAGVHASGSSTVVELIGTLATRCPRSSDHGHKPPKRWKQMTGSRESERLQFEVEPLFLNDGERSRDHGGLLWPPRQRSSPRRQLNEGAPSCPPCPGDPAAAEPAAAEPAAAEPAAADPASGEASSGDASSGDDTAAATAEPTGGDVTVAYALIAATVGGSFLIGFLLCWNLGGWNRKFWKMCGGK